MRQSVTTSSPFESIVGFSRAVRVGQIITVGGTAPIGTDGQTVAKGDAAGQFDRALQIALAALAELGASKDDVVRTRILLTNIEDWEACAKVHGALFTHHRPACTVMEVSRFIDPDWLVELELDAVVEQG